MRAISILLVLGAAGAWAQVPADGLYDVVLSGGTAVQSLDGIRIQLGDRLNLSPAEPSLFSSNNDDERFTLHFYMKDVGRAAICAGGFCVDFSSGFEHELSIPSKQAATAFAKYLGIQIQIQPPRADPGYKMALRFVPEKAVFTAAEPVKVRLEIENTGSITAIFVTGPRDGNLSFTALGPEGKAVADLSDPPNGNGLVGTATLKPGEVYRHEFLLRKWFNLSEPGVYQVQGSFSLGFINPSWSEVAMAEFSVTIK